MAHISEKECIWETQTYVYVGLASLGRHCLVMEVQEGKKNTYCHEVEILGPSKILYGGNDKPLLSCGARVVIQTDSDINIIR